MISSPTSWQIVPYDAPSPFKRVRVRDEARVRAVLRHLHNGECVALLGPALSEKSALLHDVADALDASGRARPLYLDLWQTRSDDESVFFNSLAALINTALDGRAPAAPPDVTSPRAFQHFLATRAGGQGGLALLIDHLQALPHDLVHSLLLALRAAYMERDPAAPSPVVTVVTGGMNLVGLSTGPTSPFNIAKPVVAQPLSREQTEALAQGTLEAFGCRASAHGLERIVAWASGDRDLTPRLCAWSAGLVQHHRQPHVTCAVVERAAERFCCDTDLPPIREAIRMIEEDPDTILDVLHLLDHDVLPRARARQMPTRTGADRLQLSGAVLLNESCYAFTNRAYRQAFAAHFTPERVGHVLRIAGRWSEAIEYLGPRLGGEDRRQEAGVSGQRSGGAEEQRDAVRNTHYAIVRSLPVGRNTQYATARPQLLEAIVQSIYASDAPERAYELLASGLRLGFGLTEVAIYRALPAAGRLERAYPTGGDTPAPAIDLADPACVEAQTYHLGNYALRGAADEARLVAALAAGGRALGIITVERFAQNRDPHALPGDLPDLLRFLGYAAGALENVIVRAAYRAIGQAVLNAKAMQPTVERVLTTVAEALGCDYAALYLADEAGRQLTMTAGVGRPITAEWQALARCPLAGRHPAALALSEGRMLTPRSSDDPLDRAIVERFALHKYVRAFLPLRAGGDALGTLELGYTRLGGDQRPALAAFADQVAIAVYNMQLLRRTDEALARKLAELSVGREIQLSLMPKTLPQAAGWQFAAVYQAARIVGGDFYDFCELSAAPRRVGIVIADVADKGVPAALFMALSRTIIRSVAFSGRGPAATLARANGLILNDSQAELFLSAVYAVLEPESGRLTYTNAGHNRPLWYRAADGSVVELAQRGIVLGAFDKVRLEEDSILLAPGDVLVFYTDGVTEATDADGQMYGDERLRALIAAHAPRGAQATLDALMAELGEFAGAGEWADDVTGVVVGRG